jgi:uncharacterized protein
LTDRWELTANHYVAAPLISRADGSIHSLNVLHRGALGLLEWSGAREVETGDPLFRPVIRVDGADLPLHNLAWERLERWIPRFRVNTDQLSLTATICAPAGYEAARRGLVYAFEVENRGAAEQQLEIELSGHWAWCFQTVCQRRALPTRLALARVHDRTGFALEVAGAVNAALGVAVFGADTYNAVDGQTIGEQDQITMDNGTPFRFTVGRRLRVASGRRATAVFCIGFATERTGALNTAAALRRAGLERLLKETRLELSRMTRKTRDPVLSGVMNRNLLFCNFFSLGRALDDERLYPSTSRSPLHPRCASFNERDALLWALPAVMLADPQLAREMLLRCFEQYSHRPGEALRYLDGGVLAPGFTLDQWCAYAIAIDRYVVATGDTSVLDESLVQEVLRELDVGAYQRLHPEVFLGSTELLPSGAPADQPYVSYDNALLNSVFHSLARAAPQESPERKRLSAAAEEVAAAVWRRCVADVDGLPVLAWSTDLQESASIYDDPAGSLQLLPSYGFCDENEPLWRNTVEFLRSPAYKLWLGKSPFPGLATREAPGVAHAAALCSDLMGSRRDEALEILRKLPLAGGIISDTYDPNNGEQLSGRHDAALAGFLAWSLAFSTK